MESNREDLQLWSTLKMIVVPISRREQNISNAHTARLLLLCRHIECERILMTQHPAPLNMNKPSSAETQAKPNSARRHHSRTGQEALELLLASTNELHQLPSLTINPHSQSQLPIKKNIMALNNPAVIFFPPF